MNPLLEAALKYAAEGLFVIPLHTINPVSAGGNRCTCQRGRQGLDCGTDNRSAGKHPRISDWENEATTDPEKIKAWWEQWPFANVGIACGPSALVVVDVDKEQGQESLKKLIEEHGKGEWPATRKILSGSGVGYHYDFRAPPGVELRNKQVWSLAPGVDVRAWGGQVVAPPSLHKSGNKYDFVGGPLEIVPLPAWLLALLSKKEPPKPKEGPKKGTQKQTAEKKTKRPKRASYRAQAALAKECLKVASSAKGEKRPDLINTAAFNLGQLVAAGELDEEVVVKELLKAARISGAVDDHGEEEILRQIHRGLEAGKGKPRDPSDHAASRKWADREAREEVLNDGDPRPKIFLTTEVHRVVDEAVKALERDADLYQRAEQLVTVRCDIKPPAWLSRASASPVIRSLPPPTVTERLTQAAKFYRFDGRSGKYIGAIPPDLIVRAVWSRGSYEGIRPILGVAESPFLRGDGTVCQTPGYDAATGYLLRPSIDFPAIPEAPSKAQALEALEALKEVVCDFPFLNDSHRAGWLALPLTLLARPGIAGCCPLWAFDAPTPGTGKSRLVDVASIIAFGRQAARMTRPDRDEELRKRITAILAEGEELALIDNISKPLGGDSLEALLTSTEWKDRLLSRSQIVALPARTVWAVTGNNLALGTDLVRRTLHVRLESSLESPEARAPSEFKHPELLRWVATERPRLVTSALTLLRAWYVAGKPEAESSWGSFEGWSRLVPAVLRWTGMDDPLLAHQQLAAQQDPIKNVLSAFLYELRLLLSIKQAQALSAKEILDSAGARSALLDTIEGLALNRGNKPLSAHTLGNVLRKYKKRWVGGVCLDSWEHSDSKTQRWFVRSDPGTPGSYGDSHQ